MKTNLLNSFFTRKSWLDGSNARLASHPLHSNQCWKNQKTLGSEYRKHLNPGLMIIPYSDDVTFCFWSTSKHLNTRLLILVFRFHYQGDSRESSSLEQHSRLPILDQEVHSFSLTFSKSFHLFHFQDSSKLVKYQYIKAKCLICHKKGTHFMAKYVEARKKRTGKKDGAI